MDGLLRQKGNFDGGGTTKRGRLALLYGQFSMAVNSAGCVAFCFATISYIFSSFSQG
jgi:hypothetical protein